MKELIKNLGIIILLAGIILLVIVFNKGITQNNALLYSAILVVAGFIIYLVTNRYYE